MRKKNKNDVETAIEVGQNFIHRFRLWVFGQTDRVGRLPRETTITLCARLTNLTRDDGFFSALQRFLHVRTPAGGPDVGIPRGSVGHVVSVTSFRFHAYATKQDLNPINIYRYAYAV